MSRGRRNERGRAGGGWLGDYIAAARAQRILQCVDGRGCEFCRCDPRKLGEGSNWDPLESLSTCGSKVVSHPRRSTIHDSVTNLRLDAVSDRQNENRPEGLQWSHSRRRSQRLAEATDWKLLELAG
jgi:hypothetical protein